MPKKIVGTTTDQSIQAGIMRGAIHLINGLIEDIRGEIGKEARVIATGGLAGMIAPSCPQIECVDKHLNLEGIALIYKKNC